MSLIKQIKKQLATQRKYDEDRLIRIEFLATTRNEINDIDDVFFLLSQISNLKEVIDMLSSSEEEI